MTRVTAVFNQKGGVGKTTTAQTLVSGLYGAGYKTLGVDLDAQGSLTDTFGIPHNTTGTLAAMLGEGLHIIHTEQGDILPGEKKLKNASRMFADVGDEFKLMEVLEPIKPNYTHIILDCPPQYNILSSNALMFADDVIIPCMPDRLSYLGLADVLESIRTVQQQKRRFGSSLEIAGVLITMQQEVPVIDEDYSGFIREAMEREGIRVFDGFIHETRDIRNAQANHTGIIQYAKRSKVAVDYIRFINQYLS